MFAITRIQKTVWTQITCWKKGVRRAHNLILTDIYILYIYTFIRKDEQEDNKLPVSRIEWKIKEANVRQTN